MHVVYDTDKHFVIDPITREITSTASTKNRVVQHDHNSERFTFELPRYIEGHDMSLCNRVEVHYINLNTAQGTEANGVYEVDDLRIDSEDNEKVLCSWLVSGNATRIAGVMQFVIRFACVTDGNTDYVWNTAIYSSINVVKGIHNSEVLEQKYIDVLAQWEQRLFSINDDGVANVAEAQAAAIAAVAEAAEAKKQEVLNEIPDDYITLDKNVTEYKKKVGSLANAIKGKLSGAYVRADDVSPVEHEMSVKARSKNLLPYNARSYTQNGTNYTIGENGSVTINSTPATGFHLIIGDWETPCTISGIYTMSIGTALPKGSYFWLKNTAGDTHQLITYYSSGNTTKTISLDDTYIEFGVWISVDGAFDNHVFYPMLEKGSVATEYTPYVDPASVIVTRNDGATYTPSTDGTVLGVTSLSPTMTLTTDTDGVVIDCEYNRDTNAVIADLYEKIAALTATS